MDLAKEAFHFSLVGIQGNDIVVGNGKLALALFWQQVRVRVRVRVRVSALLAAGQLQRLRRHSAVTYRVAASNT